MLGFVLCASSFVFSQSDSVITWIPQERIIRIPPMTAVVIYEKKIPLPVTALWFTEIEKGYTGQELPAVVAKTPSVMWYSDGGGFTGYSSLRLRGLDQSKVNFTLNGVPLNEPEDQGASFSNYPDLLNSIRSIQVYRGANTLNGTTSFAGLIALESAYMRDTAYTEINASAGSFRTHRLSAEFNTGVLKNNWSLYGRFSNAASDGFRKHSGTDGQSFFFSGTHFSDKGNFSFTGFTGVSKNEMAYLAEADTVLKQDYRANSLTTNEKDEFKQSMIMLQHSFRIQSYSMLTASVYYNYLQGGRDILFSPDLYNFSVKSDFGGAVVNYSYDKRRLKLNAGLHSNAYKRSHYAFIQPDESSLLYKNADMKKEFSAYAKASYEVKRFTFFGDLQYRYVQFSYQPDRNTTINFPAVNWNFINPKAGISYYLGRGNIVYLSAAKTSREPTRNDLFAGYDNVDSLNYAEVGSLNRVKPETVLDFEAGLKFSYKTLRIEFNLYDMEFKNEILAIGQPGSLGFPLRQNVASSYRRGIELSLNYRVKEWILNTQANLSTNRIKEYTADSISHQNVQPLLTPQVIINQSVDYAFAHWISAGLSGRFVSQSFLDNTGNDDFTIPSSFILNASVSIKFRKKYSIELMANNITGQKYYSAGYVQNAQPYYFAMATRNYFVTFKMRF